MCTQDDMFILLTDDLEAINAFSQVRWINQECQVENVIELLCFIETKFIVCILHQYPLFDEKLPIVRQCYT